MQLLDDDMDELFRNAASQYPLNTGGGDWEAMRNRLQQAENNQRGTATNGLTDKWWFKLGLLAILTSLFFIIAVKGLYNGERPDAGRDAIVLNKTGQGLVRENKTDAGQSTQPTVVPAAPQEIDKETIKGNNTIFTNRDDHSDTHEHVAMNDGQKVTENVEQHTQKSSTTPNSEQSIINRKHGNNTVRASVTQDIPISSYPAARPGITAVNATTALTIDNIHGIVNKDIFPAVGLANTGKIRMPVHPLPDSNNIAQTKKVKREPASLKPGLYYGLIVSPDITTVKMQRTSNVGYNIGLIAGYRISRKLAVETGILYERKYYYSDGKYFDPKKTPWPADTKILDIDGWCNMYEIPVDVRYTFATGAKSSWYVNGGMSSYIMKKQAYNYNYENNGYYGNKDWSYKKTTKDWFSIIHVGVGYERPVGVLGTLRVEPYVKIPARGIGIGELPVTSVGVNIGLTRPLRLK